MALGKLKFVREGLMGRLIGKKDWILKKSKIDSICYKEINATFFVVSCTGDAEKVITALHLLIREAQCIGGFVPGMILRT